MRNVYNSPSYGAANSVVHSGMGSYAYFHDAFFAFKALFRQGITGKGYYPGLAVSVRFLAGL